MKNNDDQFVTSLDAGLAVRLTANKKSRKIKLEIYDKVSRDVIHSTMLDVGMMKIFMKAFERSSI